MSALHDSVVRRPNGEVRPLFSSAYYLPCLLDTSHYLQLGRLLVANSTGFGCEKGDTSTPLILSSFSESPSLAGQPISLRSQPKRARFMRLGNAFTARLPVQQ